LFLLRTEPAGQKRIASLDAVRGLAVFIWLLSEIAVPVLHCFPSSRLMAGVTAQLSPAYWHGATAHDFLLPTFCFIAGASIGPAFRRRKEAGQSHLAHGHRIVKRVVLLSALGLLCESGLFDYWPSLRFVGGFQRIAICYAAAACTELSVGRRTQVGLVVFLLLDYWAALAIGTSEPNAITPYSLQGNTAKAVDDLILPGRKYFGTWDPDGILTTIPAIAVTVAGLLAAKSVEAKRLPGDNATLRLVGNGIIACSLSAAWSIVLPINSYLWTPSFCLLAMGVGLLLMGVFHAMLGTYPISQWLNPISALGRNALVAVVTTLVLERLVAATTPRVPLVQWLFPEGSASVDFAIVLTFFVILTVLWLDRRQCHITV
jgi:predicted acyltransferase